MRNPTGVVPRARPKAASLGVLVAVLLVALAVVAVRELAVDQGWATGSSWLQSLLDTLSGRTAGTAVLVVGIVLVAVGVLVLHVALRPGRVTHLATTDDGDVWLTRGALAALAHEVVDRQAGVVSVDAEPAGRRKVKVRVVARDDRAGVEQQVRDALGRRLDPLTRLRYDLDVSEVSR